MAVFHGTDQNFSQAVEQHDGLTLVDFWAPWCGPCKALSPILDQLAERFSESDLKIVKVNIDENPDTPTKYAVRMLPTMIIFKGGKPVDTKTGLVDLQALESWVKSTA